MSDDSSTPHIMWLEKEGPLPSRQVRALMAMAALLRHEGPWQDFQEEVYPVFLRSPIAREVSDRLREIHQRGTGADLLRAASLGQILLAIPEKSEGDDEVRRHADAFVARWFGASVTGGWAIETICVMIAHEELWAEIQGAVQSDPVGRGLLRGTREAKPTTKAGRRLLASLGQALSQPQYDREGAEALRWKAEAWAIVVAKYHNSPAQALRGELKYLQQATLSRALSPFDDALGLPRKRWRRPKDR